MNTSRYLLCLLFLASASAPCLAFQTDPKPSPAPVASTPQDDQQPKGPAPENPAEGMPRIPAGIFDGPAEWLNTSGPISLKDLKGKVVLLDFWTYCCINCIHVIPDLKYLEEKYPNELVVIGVHSAKFENEKLSQNIRDAILRYEIKHPVVNDSEMEIWRRFGTRSWPTLVLIDPEGNLVGSRGGEGQRELFDFVIDKVIKHHRWKGTLNEERLVFDLEAGKATPTPLRYPGKLLADEAGNRLFISDSNHNRIVVTDLDGRLLKIIGKGTMGRSDGDFNTAEFDHPQGMDLVGNTLYVADTENHLLRAIDLKSETVSTLAGTGIQGRPRKVDGRLLKTNLNSPWAICHVNDTLFIAMAGPHQIWAHTIGSDVIQEYAGNAREDVVNGRLRSSSFAQPSGLTVSGDQKFFFVADSEGSAIRQVPVDPDGKVTTIAGTSELARGQSLFAFGDIDGIADKARFQHPLGVAFHDGSVYVADTYNHKIRKVDLASGEATTWLGNGKAGKEIAQFNEPSGLSIAGGFLYVTDTNNHRILKISLADKSISVVRVEGLEPPDAKTTRTAPDFSTAQDAGEFTRAADQPLTLTIDLNLPPKGKLNELAPVSYEIFVVEGDQILNADDLSTVTTADAKDGMATISLEPAGSGTASVVVQMSYGYCESENGVCKLASAMWKLKLTAAEDSPADEITLSFPDRKSSL